MPDNLCQEESIFHKALAIDAADQRSVYLDAVCGNQPELRRRVEALLRRCAESQGPLDRPVPSLSATVDQPVAERPGTVIGPYKLLEQIGEGGFGIVFMAEQTQPVRRKVALKVLKPGMDTRQVIARFEAERQALALMDHPNIAKVLDGGTVGQAFQPDGDAASQAGKPDLRLGRPYFVMDLVKGIPITEYCDQNQLTPRERLELFAHVCQAIQHAHQKGIIHRDVKPSNVLVTLHDGQPLVKVIDFGVAKALGQQLTEKTLFTGFAQLIGTPLYMSPEQAALSNVDVDTRSDIYSLGVLLYELLTGTTPFEKERLSNLGYDEMCRIIRDEEPPKPSTRISTLGQAASTASTQRKSDPKRLSQLFRGELDWIVMKCLEKDRNRRYQTANGLAMDVQRYLSDEPVLACPPSVAYRLGKFARRNKAALAAGALVGTFLLLTVAGLAVSNILIDRERSLAQKNSALAEQNLGKARETANKLFTAVSESKLLDEPNLQPLRKDLLEAAVRFYQELATSYGDDPTSQFDLTASTLRLAQIYYQTGYSDRSASTLEKTLELVERLIQEYPEHTDLHVKLAGFWHGGRGLVSAPFDINGDLPRFQKAIAVWEKLVERYPNVTGFQSDLSKFYDLMGQAQRDGGQKTEAVHSTKKVLEIRDKVVAAQPGIYENVAELAMACGRLASLLEETDPDEAEKLYRRAVTLEKDAPNVATYQEFLAGHLFAFGSFLRQRNRAKEAMELWRQGHAIYQKLAEQFPYVGAYREEGSRLKHELDRIAVESGIAKSAEESLKKQTALLNDLSAQDAPAALATAATLYRRMGEALEGKGPEPLQGALKAYKMAISLFERLADEFPNKPDYRLELARSWRAAGVIYGQWRRSREAEQAHEESIEGLKKLVADFPDNPHYRRELALSYNTQGFQLFRLLRYQECEKEHRQALDLSEKLVAEFPNDHDYRWELACSHFFLGICLREQKRYTESEKSLRQAIQLKERLIAESPSVLDRYQLGVYHCDLATVLLVTHRPQEAEKALRVGLKLMDDPSAAASQPDVSWRVVARAYLIGLLESSGRPREAEAEFRKILELIPDAGQRNHFAWLLATGSWHALAVPDRTIPVVLAKKALESAPKEGAYWNTLGVAHYRTRDWKAAIAALEKSMQLLSGKEESFNTFFLAMAHWQLGKKEQAQKWYEKGVQWMEKNQPQNEQVRRFRAEAAQLLSLPEPPKKENVPKPEETRPQPKK